MNCTRSLISSRRRRQAYWADWMFAEEVSERTMMTKVTANQKIVEIGGVKSVCFGVRCSSM